MNNDYPEWLIILVLGFWEELDSIKYRVTKSISLQSSVADSDNSFWEQEGNTLQKRGPRGTRIPKNTNHRAETLAVMMADISNAINVTCSYEEAFSVRHYSVEWTYENERSLPLVTQELAKEALRKLGDHLNCRR